MPFLPTPFLQWAGLEERKRETRCHGASISDLSMDRGTGLLQGNISESLHSWDVGNRVLPRLPGGQVRSETATLHQSLNTEEFRTREGCRCGVVIFIYKRMGNLGEGPLEKVESRKGK